MSNKVMVSVEEAFKLGVLEGEMKALKEMRNIENSSIELVKVYINSRIRSLETALEVIRCYNSAKGDNHE